MKVNSIKMMPSVKGQFYDLDQHEGQTSEEHQGCVADTQDNFGLQGEEDRGQSAPGGSKGLLRVVWNQHEKFAKDEFLRRNSKFSAVKYLLHSEKPIAERRLMFWQECKNGATELTFTETGLTVILNWPSDYPDIRLNSNSSGHIPLRSEGLGDSVKDHEKVYIDSPLIVNGVAVRWRGWLNLDRLEGVGRLVFDQDLASKELGLNLQS